eukprot:1195821-Prorocentrum_minimum.AAC.4
MVDSGWYIASHLEEAGFPLVLIVAEPFETEKAVALRARHRAPERGGLALRQGDINITPRSETPARACHKHHTTVRDPG